MPKHQEEPEEVEAGAPLWMVTFGDMMALLLVFFVMMLSFSSVDQIKFKAFMGSMKEAFGVQNLEQLVEIPKGENMAFPQIHSAGGSIFDELNSILPQSFPGGRVAEHRAGTLLIVPGSVLFESGKAELKTEIEPFLDGVSALLRKREDLQLQIEGHTDDRPISTLQFPSNWELSTARSIAVVRFLIAKNQVSPQRLGAAGYAESRPLVPNDSVENREKNRRVEFLFLERPAQLPRLASPTLEESREDS